MEQRDILYFTFQVFFFYHPSSIVSSFEPHVSGAALLLLVSKTLSRSVNFHETVVKIFKLHFSAQHSNPKQLKICPQPISGHTHMNKDVFCILFSGNMSYSKSFHVPSDSCKSTLCGNQTWLACEAAL